MCLLADSGFKSFCEGFYVVKMVIQNWRIEHFVSCCYTYMIMTFCIDLTFFFSYAQSASCPCHIQLQRNAENSVLDILQNYRRVFLAVVSTLVPYLHPPSIACVSFCCLSHSIQFVSWVCLFVFSCHVCRSIKASNSFTSVCSLLYSVGLITTNYSLQLHRIQPHVVLTHVCKGYGWGEGGTLNSQSKGTRHLLCQRCPSHSPFSFSLDPNRWFFPSRPATHMTAVVKAASL